MRTPRCYRAISWKMSAIETCALELQSGHQTQHHHPTVLELQQIRREEKPRCSGLHQNWMQTVEMVGKSWRSEGTVL
jgi:hypothetical protein